MKTTLDIPDQLYIQIKVFAAQKKKPVRDVLIHALRTILEAEENPEGMIPLENFRSNVSGWPILNSNSSKPVSEAIINKIRDREGI